MINYVTCNTLLGIFIWGFLSRDSHLWISMFICVYLSVYIEIWSISCRCSCRWDPVRYYHYTFNVTVVIADFSIESIKYTMYLLLAVVRRTYSFRLFQRPLLVRIALYRNRAVFIAFHTLLRCLFCILIAYIYRYFPFKKKKLFAKN